jgi:hypothetical protein
MLALLLTLSVTIADGKRRSASSSSKCFSRGPDTGVARVICVVNYACFLGVFPRFLSVFWSFDTRLPPSAAIIELGNARPASVRLERLADAASAAAWSRADVASRGALLDLSCEDRA